MEHQCARTCGKCKVEDGDEDTTKGPGGEGIDRSAETETEEDHEDHEEPPSKKGKVRAGGELQIRFWEQIDPHEQWMRLYRGSSVGILSKITEYRYIGTFLVVA